MHDTLIKYSRAINHVKILQRFGDHPFPHPQGYDIILQRSFTHFHTAISSTGSYSCNKSHIHGAISLFSERNDKTVAVNGQKIHITMHRK